MKYISEKGYNMVHFTPLMQRGASNSPFSLFNQLKFDPSAFPNGEKDVEAIVNKMEKEHGLLSLTDVVWNHTAHNSEWLQHHPEAGYNRITAPHLEPAYQFDTALLEFSSKLKSLRYPTELKTKEDLLKIMEGIKVHVIAQVNLWEFYVLDVDKNTEAAINAWLNGKGHSKKALLEEGEDGYNKDRSVYEKAKILTRHALQGADRLGERYRKFVDPETAAAALILDNGEHPPPGNHEAILAARKGLSTILDEMNLPYYKEYDTDIAEALEQMYNRIEYTRLAEHGPQLGLITEERPLVETYFTRLPVNEVTKKHDPKSLAVANNGWLWDNVSNFAGHESKAYLRREVISWGDCVKLRYGDKPEDSPFLWDFMSKYTALMAKYFHGFRIDNCHSTPLHVGEHMLDTARRVRKDLYTVAELFTGDEGKDRVFLERLGLNSLVREAMVAWGPGELSRLVHRHGGKPIGSFEQDFVTRRGEKLYANGDSKITNGHKDGREAIVAITGSPAHALFMDCTHDNETPTQKRTAQDTLSNGALACMVDCGIGSVYGYDEVYPQLIDLVGETRPYEVPPMKIDKDTPGIARVKVLFNKIHAQMGRDGYTEMHVHHEDEYITMHRVHPKSHHGYFLIVHTAFGGGDHRGNISPTSIPNTKVKVIGSWWLEVDSNEETKKKVREDPDMLRGLPSKLVELESPKIDENESETVITVPDHFPPGSVTLMETWIPGIEGSELDDYCVTGAEDAFARCDLADLNFALYRCEAEERDSSGDGVYDIPGYGPLVYAGLQGWWSVLQDIVQNNDLAHPLCQHLRDGQWALDYTAGRMETLTGQGHKGLEAPAKWMRERLNRIRKLPSFLLPRYFSLVLQTAYTAAVERAISQFDSNIGEGTEFLRSLALTSLQMTGYVSTR